MNVFKSGCEVKGRGKAVGIERRETENVCLLNTERMNEKQDSLVVGPQPLTSSQLDFWLCHLPSLRPL